jgi:phosphoglycolate phosphatase-like HAD superfamily hydrolase
MLTILWDNDGVLVDTEDRLIDSTQREIRLKLPRGWGWDSEWKRLGKSDS